LLHGLPRTATPQVCAAVYNTCGTGGEDVKDNNRSAEEIINNWYYQVTEFTDRPLCIAEISTTGHCGNKVGTHAS
jgi:hypothetical protein